MLPSTNVLPSSNVGLVHEAIDGTLDIVATKHPELTLCLYNDVKVVPQACQCQKRQYWISEAKHMAVASSILACLLKSDGPTSILSCFPVSLSFSLLGCACLAECGSSHEALP